MKFGATLAEQQVPEWAPAYVEYRRMKKKIKAMVQHAKEPTHVQKGEAAEAGKSLLVGADPHGMPRASMDVRRSFELVRKSFEGRRSGTPARAEGTPHVYDPDEEEASFFRMLEHQADDCNRFYEQRVADFEKRQRALEGQVERLMAEALARHHQRARRSILAAFRELHSALDKLTNYCVLNLTAFSKICKKYQRLLPWRHVTAERRVRELLRSVDQRAFAKHEALQALRESTERLFAEHFTGGDRRLAVNRMRVVPVSYTEVDVLRLGLYVGACAPSPSSSPPSSPPPTPRPLLPTAFAVLRVYKGLAMLILMAWLWAGNVFVFHRYHVNYRFIFELDVSSALEYHQLAELAAFLTALWLASACAYVCAIAGLPPHPKTVPAYVHPLSLVLLFILIAAWPGRQLFTKSRRWLARALVEVALAPLFFVEFRHFFLGDQLTSNTRTLLDIEFIACFFLSGSFLHPDVDEHRCTAVNAAFTPAIAALPFWFRFAQCGRRYRDTRDTVHIVNAGKYFSGLLAVAMQTTHQHFPHVISKGAWVGAQLAATLYSLSWDFKMDWGLLACAPGGGALLRPQLMYGPRAYYAAMVADALLRFTWVFSAWPQALGVALHPEQLFLALQTGEICRRFMWNLFRLENEQLNNQGQFRAVRAIPLPYFVRAKSDGELETDGEHPEGSPPPGVQLRVVPVRPASEVPSGSDPGASVRGDPAIAEEPPAPATAGAGEGEGEGEREGAIVHPIPIPLARSVSSGSVGTPKGPGAQPFSTLARNRSSRVFHAIDPSE
eukprot:tig00001128_g7167.t1